MKRSFLLLLAGSLLAVGCTKTKLTADMLAQFHNHHAAQQADGGDDDDDPVVMHVTMNIAGDPLPGSFVVLVNSTDTLSGFTDSTGSFRFSLPRKGWWRYSIANPGYKCITGQENITDSFTKRTDKLSIGQCQ